MIIFKLSFSAVNTRLYYLYTLNLVLFIPLQLKWKCFVQSRFQCCSYTEFFSVWSLSPKTGLNIFKKRKCLNFSDVEIIRCMYLLPNFKYLCQWVSNYSNPTLLVSDNQLSLYNGLYLWYLIKFLTDVWIIKQLKPPSDQEEHLYFKSLRKKLHYLLILQVEHT